MTDRLYGLPGAEDLQDDMGAVADLAFDDGMDSPITIEEFTTKPIRSFVKAQNVMERIIDYDLEEAMDEYGDVTGKLYKRMENETYVAFFELALDHFLADLGYCWADKHVATWTCTWETDENGDHSDFVFTKVEP